MALLAEAGETATELGMAPLVARVETLGAQLRASPTPRYPDRLTRREVEVLRLIARGRSNQAIADELVLSVRTVERHITNLYGKIGAGGRADATAYALTRHLVDGTEGEPSR